MASQKQIEKKAELDRLIAVGERFDIEIEIRPKREFGLQGKISYIVAGIIAGIMSSSTTIVAFLGYFSLGNYSLSQLGPVIGLVLAVSLMIFGLKWLSEDR